MTLDGRRSNFAVHNPATDEVIAQVPNCGLEQARAAIDAAARAFVEWRERTAFDRASLLHTLAELMLRDRERLAELMTRECGKPLSESRGEVAYAASFIEWAAGEAARIYGETVPASVPDKRILVLKQPVGVTAAITPWNFPSAMVARKLGPALAAGCTMVVKPAEETPLSAIAIGELADEAGFPAGVVSIVTSDDPVPIAKEMLTNSIVRKLSFTGSTEVGRKLMAGAAQNLTRLSLELGGHAPFIVFDDADIDAAVRSAIASKFRNAGQTCICANRFSIHRSVYDDFAAKFRKAVEELKVGYGLQEGVQVGPLINDDAVEKVSRHVEDARSRGAKVTAGGRLVKIDGCADRFYAPTVIEHVTADMLVSCEETFGPVAPLRAFDHEEEAIEWANDTPYGLAAYFFSRDAGRLMRVAERLEFGVIGANDGLPSTAQAPFGGMKHSGFGREGGKWGVEEYLDIKYISWGVG